MFWKLSQIILAGKSKLFNTFDSTAEKGIIETNNDFIPSSPSVICSGFFFVLAETYQDRRTNQLCRTRQRVQTTAVLPYVKGLSEQLRRYLEQQGVRAIFKWETTLRSQLVRPKDAVDPDKRDGVVSRIPCECGKMYIGERVEDLCKTDLRSTIETFDSPVPRPPPFRSMPSTPETSHS